MRLVSLFGKVVALLLLPLVLANCQTASNNASSSQISAASMSGFANQDTDYKIARNDILQVTVFQVPDLTRPVQVSGGGFVDLPLIGKVNVAGKTTDQAQAEIATLYGKSHLKSPQVSIVVAKSGQKVTVNGAVKNSSVITVDGRLTLSQAVAQAGGLSEVAEPTRIHVARVMDQKVQDTVYDITQVEAGQIPDPSLQGGDIIVVKSSGQKVALKNLQSLLPFMMLMTFL